MSCPAADRGHRRSWSWSAMESRICCAGRNMSETDPGMPGCPGSSPPGIPSGTATTWSAYAPMRCGAWRTRPRMCGCRAACWAAMAGSGRGPRLDLSREALTIPGRRPGMMTRSGDSAACCTTDSRRGLLLGRGRRPMTMLRTGSPAGVNEQPPSKSTCQGVWQEHEPPAHAEKRALYVALLRASRRAHSPLSEHRHLARAPQRSLTVLDNCQHVTIVAAVLVVACDDTDVSNEPTAVTGTATARSVSRMDSYA